MRHWSLLLILSVVGCGPQPMPCGNEGTGGFGAAGPGGTGGFGFAGGAGGGDGNGKRLGLVGKPITVQLTIPRTVFCGAGSTADEVVTEVVDASNHPVAHTKGAVQSTTVNTFGFDQPVFAVDVTFTPMQPGSHHLAARFEPALGSSQQDVDVAADGTGFPSKTLSLGVTCAALDVAASGLVLCLKDTDQLVMFRDEMSLAQTIDADDFEVVGDKVWTTRFGVVKRWTDVGGPNPLGDAVSRDTTIAERGTLVVSENEATFVTTSGVVRLAVSGGALAEKSRVYPPLWSGWSLYPTENPTQLLIATGNNIGAGGQLCPVDTATTTSIDCTALTGMLLGSDETGIWLNAGDVLTHLRWEGGIDGGSVARSTLRFPGLQGTASHHFPNTPVFVIDGKNVVPRFSKTDGIALEGYDLPPGYALVPSSAKTVRAQTAAGTHRLFSR